MTKDEALKLALEALESVTKHFTRAQSTLRDSEVRGEAHKAITAIREALAEESSGTEQPAQRIAAVMPCGAVVENVYEAYESGKRAIEQPAQRKPLTDELIESIFRDHGWSWGKRADMYIPVARAIEAAHGITESTK